MWDSSVCFNRNRFSLFTSNWSSRSIFDYYGGIARSVRVESCLIFPVQYESISWFSVCKNKLAFLDCMNETSYAVSDSYLTGHSAMGLIALPFSATWRKGRDCSSLFFTGVLREGQCRTTERGKCGEHFWEVLQQLHRAVTRNLAVPAPNGFLHIQYFGRVWELLWLWSDLRHMGTGGYAPGS